MNTQSKRSKRKPKVRITDPAFIYYPSSDTDVQRTWRAHGWVPTQHKKERGNERAA